MTNLAKRTLLSIWFIALFAAPVLAADPTHDYSTSAALSELTRQELQQWAVYYWQHQETGTWSAEAQAFEFTHPEEMPPGFVKFGDALELFHDLYQDQLNLDTQGEYYGIDQLIDDDEQVRNQFKLYTTTGLLIMGSASAPAAVMHHQLAAIEAMTIGESYEIGQLQYLNQYAVVTVNLRRLPRPTLLIPPVPNPLDAEQLPAKIKNFHYWLRAYRRRLDDGIYQLYYAPEYPRAGFDCKDFADALAQWLRRRFRDPAFGFQDATFKSLYLKWEVNGGQVGHAMIQISEDGYYWILDPETGVLLGPFTAGTPINVSPLLEAPGTPERPGYRVPAGTPITITGPFDPDYRPQGNSDRWWTNPDMRNRFEERTGYRWYWYAPDRAPLEIDEIILYESDPDVVNVLPVG